MNIFSSAMLVSAALTFCALTSAAQDNSEFKIERRNYEASSPAGGLFSQAVKHGRVLYLSGVTAFGSEAQGKGIAEQARVIFARIRAIAEAEGTDLSSLIKVTIFVTDIGKAADLREELARQYAGQPPASSLVAVNSLFSPEVDIEIEAILGL